MKIETDIVIIGGGIAGLWLLNRLRQQGFSVVLLEANTLGGGQTIVSQGIIHGGMKYALLGTLTPAAKAIAEMPLVWRHCLEGGGEIDLSGVPILSSHQYLCSTGKLTSKLTTFFAGLALKSHVQAVQKADFPSLFQHKKFKGRLYSLDEMVVDVPALIHELAKPHREAIIKINPLREEQIKMDANHKIMELSVETTFSSLSIQIQAQKYIFTAGAGNEMLFNKLKLPSLAMQRRPLQMVIVKHAFPDKIYAHYLGLSATPRITITSHAAADGQTIWYLGGDLAESGVKRSPVEQIAFAQQELMALFPWLDFSTARFASFYIDRAEPYQPDGKRPDSCFIKEIENMIVAWPTKLAFAPLVARETLQILANHAIQRRVQPSLMLSSQDCPAVAKPVWEDRLC